MPLGSRVLWLLKRSSARGDSFKVAFVSTVIHDRADRVRRVDTVGPVTSALFVCLVCDYLVDALMTAAHQVAALGKQSQRAHGH